MIKKILAGLLSVILMVGILTVYLPADEANAASLCYSNYRQVSTKNFSFPFKLFYRIVKYPAMEVPADPGTTPEPGPGKEVEPTPQPEPKPEPTPVPEPKPEPEPAPEQPVPNEENGLNQYELKVVELVNVERQKNGLKELKIDPELAKVARLKSADMRDNNYFSHQSPTYGSPFEMMKQFGISYRTAGENIAAGQRTPEAVVRGWMNSSGHSANILNPNFTHIGVGYVEGGSYGTYSTQQFIGK